MTNKPDAIGIIDEAGLTGKVRNLTSAHDGKIGVVASLMLPDADLGKWETIFAPPFKVFCDAAPSDAKLHITDAFASKNEKWIAAAKEARQSVIDLVKEHRLLIVYTARDASVARESHAMLQEIKDRAKAGRSAHISISERPSNTRHVSECFQGVVSIIDVLAENFRCDHVALFSDEIDSGVLADMEAAADKLRHISRREVHIRGYDKTRNAPVLGKIAFASDMPGVDVTRVGKIQKLGKTNGLVFAIDVIVNALLHHLQKLPERSALNTMAAVEGWCLEQQVFAPPEDAFDIYSKI